MNYIDLFAGCGGLSLGFERAGFELALALEKSEMATETFYHNFIEHIGNENAWKQFVKNSTLKEQYEKKLITKELIELLNDKELMHDLSKKDIDIVVGGPPCQGFSMAGRRNPKDARNVLPWQFLQFVEAVNPKAVVIENVVGMSRNFKKQGEKAPFEELQEALRQTGPGYIVQPIHINAMHYGVPEHRPRLMILGLRKDIAQEKNITTTNQLWRSDFSDLIRDLPPLAPAPTTKTAEVRTIRDAIADLAGIPESSWSTSGKKFLNEMKDAKIWKLKPTSDGKIPNQTDRKHQEKAINRFRIYQYLRDQGFQSKILNIPTLHDENEAKKILTQLLAKCTFPSIAPDGTLLSNNVKELVEKIIEYKTKKHSQRPLHWNKPSPTVVTLPDDYVHPSEPRIFTVRELARFQSFPDAFEFRSKETTGSDRRRFEVPQYTQVGNAVAPLVAYAVGKRFADIL